MDYNPYLSRGLEKEEKGVVRIAWEKGQGEVVPESNYSSC